MSGNVIKKFEWKPLPKKDSGETDEHVQKLSLSRRMVLEGSDPKTAAFVNAMGSLAGIDGVNVVSPYSLIVVIADCFDVIGVLADATKLVEDFHSKIITPNKNLSIVR